MLTKKVMFSVECSNLFKKNGKYCLKDKNKLVKLQISLYLTICNLIKTTIMKLKPKPKFQQKKKSFQHWLPHHQSTITMMIKKICNKTVNKYFQIRLILCQANKQQTFYVKQKNVSNKKYNKCKQRLVSEYKIYRTKQTML